MKLVHNIEFTINYRKNKVLESLINAFENNKKLKLLRYNKPVGLMKIKVKHKAFIINPILTLTLKDNGEKTKINIYSKKRKSIFTKNLFKTNIYKTKKVLKEEILKHLNND